MNPFKPSTDALAKKLAEAEDVLNEARLAREAAQAEVARVRSAPSDTPGFRSPSVQIAEVRAEIALLEAEHAERVSAARRARAAHELALARKVPGAIERDPGALLADLRKVGATIAKLERELAAAHAAWSTRIAAAEQARMVAEQAGERPLPIPSSYGLTTVAYLDVLEASLRPEGEALRPEGGPDGGRLLVLRSREAELREALERQRIEAERQEKAREEFVQRQDARRADEARHEKARQEHERRQNARLAAGGV